jgi:hypothetical protein
MANNPTKDIDRKIWHLSYILQDRKADLELFSRVSAKNAGPPSAFHEKY